MKGILLILTLIFISSSLRVEQHQTVYKIVQSQVLSGSYPRLRIHIRSDGKLDVIGGCNSMEASYKTKGDLFEIVGPNGWVSTKKACANNTDYIIQRAFGLVRKIKRTQNGVQLLSNIGKKVFVLEKLQD